MSSTYSVYGPRAYLPLNSYRRVSAIEINTDRPVLNPRINHYEIVFGEFDGPFGIEKLYEVSVWVFGIQTKLWMTVSKDEAWRLFDELKCARKTVLDNQQVHVNLLNQVIDECDNQCSKVDRAIKTETSAHVQICLRDMLEADDWITAYAVDVWPRGYGYTVLKTVSQTLAWHTFFELSSTLNHPLTPEF